MKIISETSISNFEAWSGAVKTLQKIREAGKCDELELLLEDMYPDGMTDTQLNDLLWFEEDTVYDWLGIANDDEEDIDDNDEEE